MVEFKSKADQIIKERWGIEVEHRCAMKNGEKLTYEKLFYHVPNRKPETLARYEGGGALADHRFPIHSTALVQRTPQNPCTSDFPLQSGVGAKSSRTAPIYGYPISLNRGNWCTQLKTKAISGFQRFGGGAERQAISKRAFSKSSLAQGAKKNIVQYLGIAADEPERIARHQKPGFMLPLVEIGWDEAYCRQLCEENDLLSPIYTTATRGGCWFCHNQGVDQLRLLRKTYPDLWALLLKWDTDSPTSFKADGHTVHDYDLRYEMEDEGLVPADRKFRWKMLEGKNKIILTQRKMLRLLGSEVRD